MPTRTHALTLAAVAAFCLTLAPAAHADLMIDFGDRAQPGPGNPVQGGFDVFTITNIGVTTTRSFGSVDVTVSDTNPAGNPQLDDRYRTDVPNSGAFTQSALLSDFVFGDNGVAGQGLDVLIEGLAPNQLFRMQVWSYDSAVRSLASNITFLADWTANGELVADDFSSKGPLPTDNDDYSFTFFVQANASGEILLQARQSAASVGSAGVLNAFTVTAVPAPMGGAMIGVGLLGLALRRPRRTAA